MILAEMQSVRFERNSVLNHIGGILDEECSGQLKMATVTCPQY